MLSISAICLLALSASVAAVGVLGPIGGIGPLGAIGPIAPLGYGGLPYAAGHIVDNRPYAFDYAVRDPHTGDNKGVWENRVGGVQRGAYSSVEPGGGVRTIEYVADDVGGFNYAFRRAGPKLHPGGAVSSSNIDLSPIGL